GGHPGPASGPRGSTRFRHGGQRTRESWRHHMIPPTMDMGLTNLRVLVTGGSAGIGLAAAELLHAEGARVMIASRHPEQAAGSIGVAYVAADLATAEGCDHAVTTAVDGLDGLDVLVNNVGVAWIGQFADAQDATWQTAWDTNVMSYVRCIRAALPALRASPAASIVNVASTSGKRPSSGMPEYSITKAAVLSLSRLVADVHAGD